MVRIERHKRYRVTRAAFDVVAVFPMLQARAVPGPVVARVLALHGYSESAVRNRLVRMVDQGQLERERCGTTSRYRVAAALGERMGALRYGPEGPRWEGSFHAVVLSISEGSRNLRDRVTYAARYHGYRPLRPGVLLSFADASDHLRTRLGEVLEDGDGVLEEWVDFCRITPADDATARRWVRRAFLSDDVPARIAALEQAVDEFDPTGLDGFLVRYMDLLYEAMMMLSDVVALPPEFADLTTSDARLHRVIGRLNDCYGRRLALPVLEHAMAEPSARLIEFEDGESPPA